MILSLSQRSCCSTLAFIAIMFALLSLAASHGSHHGHSGTPSPSSSTPSAIVSNCSAEITLNSTEPSTAFYIYHDIIVENTGLCDITGVFVNITLPPDDTVFTYYNVSNSTGELFGLTSPMPQGSVQVGGTIVLNSARIPIIVVGALECSATCNAASPAGIPSAANPTDTTAPTDLPSGSSEASSGAPVEASSAEASSAETSSADESSEDTSSDSSSSGIQVEVKRGSNAYWFGVNVLSGGEVSSPRKVQFRDSSADASWLRMDSANWGKAPTFTYSPTTGPLVLPISLRITFSANEVTILNDVITSFSADTYSSSQATRAAPEGIDA